MRNVNSSFLALPLGIAVALAGALSLGACAADDGAPGKAGPAGDGSAGTSCTVSDNGDGTATISCDDGTSVTVANGVNGDAGSGCTVTDNNDGTKTIKCDDGTSVTVTDGDASTGNPGKPGLNAGETPGLNLAPTVTAPANGTHYVAGTITPAHWLSLVSLALGAFFYWRLRDRGLISEKESSTSAESQ